MVVGNGSPVGTFAVTIPFMCRMDGIYTIGRESLALDCPQSPSQVGTIEADGATSSYPRARGRVGLPSLPGFVCHAQCVFSHSARKHGYRHEAWFFLRGTICFVCLTQFWSEERLFHHWSARCTACFARVRLGASPLGREELAALLAVVRNRRAAGLVVGRDRKGLRPAIRLPGPVVQPE